MTAILVRPGPALTRAWRTDVIAKIAGALRSERVMFERRLVETGVTFVEVTLGGWDTHADNFAKVKKLAGQVDQPFAQLVSDLKQRGILDSTLVVWMGEFGRTPKINPKGGRDHYPRTSNVLLAGGGVRGGQVIGKTDESGTEVADRPVTVPDLWPTRRVKILSRTATTDVRIACDRTGNRGSAD